MMMMIDVDKLRLHILKSGLKLKELATKANISESTITRMLHNSQKFSMFVIARIAKALQIDPADLLKV